MKAFCVLWSAKFLEQGGKIKRSASLTESIDPERRDERLVRILTAALAVFSEHSLEQATTDKVAKRARISKRDLYAAFPTKHDLLVALIHMVLQADEQDFAAVVADSEASRSVRERLEIIGLAVIREVLSPGMAFVVRVVSTEGLDSPQLGAIYYEKWYSQRCQTIAQVLRPTLGRKGRGKRRTDDAGLAAKQYMALMSHLPQVTVTAGMRQIWTAKAVQMHVQNAVECFVHAFGMGD